MELKSKRLLTSASDVKDCREELLGIQGNKDAMTGLDLALRDAVLDHCHKSTLVRGVLHRQTNAALGKLENVYRRLLGWWIPIDLPTFLRSAADYLEQEDLEILHPHWVRKSMSLFNSLNAAQQNALLKEFGRHKQKTNLTERRKLFREVLTKRLCTFGEVQEAVEGVKNK